MSNVTTINVAGVARRKPPRTKTTLDVEWAGALAPGAKIRLYLSANSFNCFSQILNDLPSNPTMGVVVVQWILDESAASKSSILGYSQTLAQLAAWPA